MISVLCLIVFFASLMTFGRDSFREFIKINVGLALILLVSWIVSFHVVDQNPYENKQVVGNFVGYQASSHVGSKGRIYHSAYVIYEVDGNHILLRANEGRIYPKQAILYKN